MKSINLACSVSMQGPSKFALDVLNLVRREERRLSGRRSLRREMSATEKIEERVRGNSLTFSGQSTALVP